MRIYCLVQHRHFDERTEGTIHRQVSMATSEKRGSKVRTFESQHRSVSRQMKKQQKKTKWQFVTKECVGAFDPNGKADRFLGPMPMFALLWLWRDLHFIQNSSSLSRLYDSHQ